MDARSPTAAAAPAVDPEPAAGGSPLFRALEQILERTAFRSGDDYLAVMVTALAEVLGVRYALIGRLHATEWRAVTLGLWAGDQIVPNMEYDLRGTPCEKVVNREACCFTAGVQAQFPEDALLVEMGAESYVGAPTFDTDGKPLGLVAILDDKPIPPESVRALQELLVLVAAAVTSELERQRVVDWLERSRRELADANAAKARFLANISHEIRTPLNGIIGSAGLLEYCDDGDRRELVETIGQCGHLLLSIIEDVLDLSRMEAGELQLGSAPLSLRELMDDMEAAFKVQASQLGIDLVFERHGDDVRVLGDRTRLRQVMLNLIGNALKFTNQGTISVRALAVAEAGRVACELEVEDTGCGVPPAMREAIFDAFVQADGSPTRNHGGAGLGLAITKEIVTAMNGTISCSEADRTTGALFRVKVVLDQARPAAAETMAAVVASGPATDCEHVRVMLVEDSPINRRVATMMLEKLGCEVTTAKDGVEATQRFKPDDFDLVFMDCQMPEKDGLAATSEIRAAGHGTPVVALTAHGSHTAEERRVAGMDDCLSKPVTLDALREMVQRWAPVRENE